MTATLAGSSMVSRAAWVGAGLALLNTLVSVSADAIAKDLIVSYAAPQLMALSGGLVVLAGLGAAAAGPGRFILRTGSPALVALRSIFGAASTVCFFLAFRDLAFAEVFVFVAIMPIFGAVLSGLLLRERIRLATWGALGFGLIGLLMMEPDCTGSIGPGYLAGLGASLLGAASIVLSRRICRSHTHSFTQVFYAQLACALVGFAFLPQVWQPMGAGDLMMLGVYTGFLVITRWLIVIVVKLLPAYVVMQITNIQFLWMVIIGQILFGETVRPELWAGAALVIGSGLWLVQAQRRAG